MKTIALAVLIGAAALCGASTLIDASVLNEASSASAGQQAAAPVTLTGQISDSLCKAKHEEAAEGQGKMADHDCTVACVRGGSKYVLLSAGKVYQIANQEFRDLATRAGQTVKLTGALKGEEITVSRIEEP